MIRDLLINYRKDPIGLDERPRFSWKLESGKQDVVQKCYQIQVICCGKMKWDSGMVESDRSILIPYEGEVLQPMTSYQVQVNVWDNYGALGQAAASFETGLMTNVYGNENWKAKWITHTLPEEETACPVFVRKFALDRKGRKVKKARLYTTACGVYEACVNGKRVGDVFMAPGWTSYPNRIAYQTYDITDLLIDETDGGAVNEIAITVGNGWYKGELGFNAKPDNYGDRTALLAMLHIVYRNGEEAFIGTDPDWMTETGVIRYSEIYHGETQDFTVKRQTIGQAVLFDYFNMETAEAYSEIFDDSESVRLEETACVHAGLSEDVAGAMDVAGTMEMVGTTAVATKRSPDSIPKIVSQESEPVRITKRFPVREKIITPKGEVVFDFGQNMAGLVEICLPELVGDCGRLVIRHAETLDKDGNFYTENLRTAKCTDTYIYGSEQAGMTVMPHFTFHGFRYICVEGAGKEVSGDLFTACAMHTDMPETGNFHSDNSLVNQLQSNIQWGQRSNFFDIPTDCPQRDERLGWTGDAQVFSGTASYNFNTALFFRKWLRDMAAETTAEWGVPHVVPNILGSQDGAAAWSDAAVIIPWKLYQAYGDQEMLSEQFPMMKAWVDYIRGKVLEAARDTQEVADASGRPSVEKAEPVLWQTGFQYGDWLALDIESGSIDRTGGTDKYLVANACYANSLRIVRDAAAALGKKEEAEQYGRLYDQLVDAINQEYVTATGRLVCETQTACVLMLYFDLIRPEHRSRVLETLKTNINVHHGHLTTGFVGTPYLCHCLSENGLHDLADEIFMKEDFPGWLYAVKKGATTIWERWNSILPDGNFDESGMNSLNHYAYGSIGSWLYEKVAGIRPLKPGYKEILIRPFLTKGITECSATYESVYGTIQAAWSCKDGRICVDVQIPANTTAVLRLPEKEKELYVGSGTYHYEYETQTCLEKDRYTMDSTFGELVAEELGRTLLEQAEPGMLDNPLIQYAFGMTISELVAMAPDSQPLYQAVMDALNKKAREQAC